MKKLLLVADQKRIQYKAHFIAFEELLLDKFSVDSYCDKSVHNRSFNLLNKSITNYSVVIILFPSIKALIIALYCRIRFVKVYYWYHEPFSGFKSYLVSGNSVGWALFFYLKSFYSDIISLIVNSVRFPSLTSASSYKNNLIKNSDLGIWPLFFSSRVSYNNKCRYLSFLGGLNPDHNIEGFISMVEKNSDLILLYKWKILIATRDFLADFYRIRLINSCVNFEIIDNKPLPENIYNDYYSSSFLIWNAYNRSSQSGVLINGLRHGCIPIINCNTSYFDLLDNCGVDVADIKYVLVMNEEELFKRSEISLDAFKKNFSIIKFQNHILLDLVNV